jgi:hypothetical protein
MRIQLPGLVSIPRAATVLAAGLLGMSACVQPAPTPPAPRALTIYPQRRQSQAQQNQDKGECSNTASATATSSDTWAQIFAACMSGRGYGVE